MEYIYQVEALKDDYEELEENYKLVQKELKSLSRQHQSLIRDHKSLQEETAIQTAQYEQKFTSQAEEKTKLLTQIEQLAEELQKHKKLLEESEKARLEALNKQIPVADEVALARETNKQTREYHYKWKMAEQENNVLQTSLNRLENQVARYKDTLKEAETVEADLKAEKRKLLRELREVQAKVEELETNNTHLQKRLDRLRSRNLITGGDTSTTASTGSTLVPTTHSLPQSTTSSLSGADLPGGQL